MVAVKAHEADRLFQKTDKPPSNICLIYGPDRGLVDERARRFVQATSVDTGDPFSYVALQGTDVSGPNAQRLIDEVSTVSMFGGRRLIQVSDVGADAKVAAAVAQTADTIADDTFLLLQAGDLKKTAPIRTTIEKSKSAIAVPCYADDAKSLQAVIDDEMRSAGKQLTLDARQYLIANLGGDRGTTRRELEKLLLFCHHVDRIELEHVAAIMGDTSATVIDEIVDGLLIGDLLASETALTKLENSGTSASIVLNALSRQLQQLDQMRSTMTAERKSARAVVEGARPPVFFKRKPILTKALELWSSAQISAAIEKIRETTLASRGNTPLENSHVRMMILSLGYKAYSSARRS